MTIEPRFEFNKNDIGLGAMCIIENTGKKYKCRYEKYHCLLGLSFLWFTLGIVITIRGDVK